MPMMAPSGGGFPWLVVVVPALIAALFLIAAIVAVRLRAPSGRRKATNAVEEMSQPEDPMAVLRERLARGDIDLAEFERRVEGLLRSDPAERITWIAPITRARDNGDRAFEVVEDREAR